MRALVISGGGSKGAFAGGVAQYLIEQKKNNYDLFIGTSTGSLLVSHLALRKVDEIKSIYTNVNQNSIFSHCPFKIKTKHGVENIGIHHFNIIKNFIKGSKTFGESYNLKKLIEDSISEVDFNTLKQNYLDVVVTVSNLSLNQVEYKSIKDFSYLEFCEWIWISCNYTPFMSLVKKNGCEYADGGFTVNFPIQYATEKTNYIDAIIHAPEDVSESFDNKNILQGIPSIINMLMDANLNKDIKSSEHFMNHGKTINYTFTPYELTDSAMFFDKHQMKMWFDMGYNL